MEPPVPDSAPYIVISLNPYNPFLRVGNNMLTVKKKEKTQGSERLRGKKLWDKNIRSEA